MDDFRLGVQKCRKTIEDGVGNSGIFRIEGLDALFKMLRMAAGKDKTQVPLVSPIPLIYSVALCTTNTPNAPCTHSTPNTHEPEEFIALGP